MRAVGISRMAMLVAVSLSMPMSSADDQAFAQSNWRSTMLTFMRDHCRHALLRMPQKLTSLAILNITLRSQCDCVAPQVVSRMSDADYAGFSRDMNTRNFTLA